MSSYTLSDTERAYEEFYKTLNEGQKKAVDTLQGPVLVVAGPGTGKTQIIAARIMNLLRSTDDQVEPHNILCLTYTDNGAVSMRKRLLQFIGPSAHQIKICTFHSFCNDVIQANLDYFEKSQLELIAELERVQLLEEIINNLPYTNILKRLKGDLYYEAARMSNLYSNMKSENWMPEYVNECIDTYIRSLPERDGFYYKRKHKEFSAGDVNVAKIEAEVKRMESLQAAVALYPTYTQMMRDRNRYDYQDMILWVINAFNESPNLLLRYKEQYRYVLVDEFQDTNGAQNDILNLLTDDPVDQYPNIFCVGDDDQSIYEFQGARLKNITDFATKYKKNLQTIVLRENYRSTQAILDVSKRVIENNNERLVKVMSELDKNIIAALNERLNSPAQPLLLEYLNTIQEEAGICLEIERLIQKEKVKPSDIAVLYYRHAQADNLIAFFNKRGIPYQVKKKINVLDQILIQQLINIMQYIDTELKNPHSGEDSLFQIMHYYFFGIHPHDMAHIRTYIGRKDMHWRDIISDTHHLKQIKLRTPDAISSLSTHLTQWISASANLTLQMLFERIIYDSGLVSYILQHNDRYALMEQLNTFYDFLKTENNKNPKLSISDFLQTLQQMDTHNISLDMNKTVFKEDGVVFSSCHGAKGSEFRYVFVIGCVKNIWEASTSNNKGYPLPDTLTFSTESNQLESARRLFYVALTRAKEFLTLSYHRFSNEQKEVERSLFVEESGLEATQVEISDEDLLRYQMDILVSSRASVQLPERDFLKLKLEHFALSPSSFNTYLKCPIEFYFKYILNAPFATNDSLVFGSAIHKALEELFKEMKLHHNVFPSKEKMFTWFKSRMNQEREAFTEIQFRNRTQLGEQVLNNYYDTNVTKWHKDVELEFKINQVQIHGVPCTGKMDKIEIFHQNVIVVDYKTGNPDNAAKNIKPPTDSDNGGEYWRQMYFYKLLIDAYKPNRNWNMIQGVFAFVEKNKRDEYENKVINIEPQYMDWMQNKVVEVYAKIQNLEFDKGCEEESCSYCNFVKQNQIAFDIK